MKIKRLVISIQYNHNYKKEKVGSQFGLLNITVVLRTLNKNNIIITFYTF